MCHGAGGVTAQHRFGARTGVAPIAFGAVLLVLALGFAGSAAALFAAIPVSAVGALLLLAGTDLAVSKRLFDARPDCWPVIGIAAGATALLNPAVGLLPGGWWNWGAVPSTPIPQMVWAGRTEGRGNAGETAASFFHPSDPSGLGYLIQRKRLI